MKYKVLKSFFHRGLLLKPGAIVELPDGQAAGPHLQKIEEAVKPAVLFTDETKLIPSKPLAKPTPDLTPPTKK